ncbi:MAG: HAD family hydrolase [Alphaproteobacteria bacterium]|nr:HAD family hydrolase [Alphaproteobacteria bacterium]
MNGSLERPNAIFFDWDGTLVDSVPLIRAGYDDLYAHYGLPPITMDQLARNMRNSARELFPQIFGDQAAQALAHFYDYIHAHHFDHLIPYDGALDFLKSIHGKGLKTAIVSNRKHELLSEEIPHLGWSNHVDFIVGAGKCARDKPAPDQLLYAAEELGIDPKTQVIWYVGDSETDLIAANHAHMIPIFIEHGLRSLDDCHAAGLDPVHVVDIAALKLQLEALF